MFLIVYYILKHKNIYKAIQTRLKGNDPPTIILSNPQKAHFKKRVPWPDSQHRVFRAHSRRERAGAGLAHTGPSQKHGAHALPGGGEDASLPEHSLAARGAGHLWGERGHFFPALWGATRREQRRRSELRLC